MSIATRAQHVLARASGAVADAAMCQSKMSLRRRAA